MAKTNPPDNRWQPLIADYIRIFGLCEQAPASSAPELLRQLVEAGAVL